MDKIKSSYRQSRNIYDDVLTQNRWWSRLYIRLFWSGTDDNEIAEKLLAFIPDDFSGTLLDVPVGTAVFTRAKYFRMKKAKLTCLDYSEDMLAQAEARLEERSDISFIQGDVGKLPFPDESFDLVLSMNGVHAFPDKEKAYSEMNRVLKQGGAFIACFYIKGKSRMTDFLVRRVLSARGWFTPPFETEESLRKRLEDGYDIEEFLVDGSMVCFKAIRK